ncbi:hypothetical protein FACS18942_04940 [Planctomycetales bacterium]|nr:hypothetical protein FACS18942_04940 [Planctomycetales bacterium]GHT33805.1 hypothetical protein FACS189427_00020 [Planctomycetales bacterium]
MAKLERNGIQRQIATLSDSEISDSVEDYVAEHGGEGGNPPLPEDIVIDPDYVHTDNNYDNAAAEKLAGLQNYDDTSVNESITNETARATAAETALSETDNELRQSIDAETQRAANAETALTPKSWNWDYVMRNMASQNTADAVIIATTWGYLDTFGNKTEQTFPFALPMADSTQAGVMSKEQAQQILDNTSAIGLIHNAGYINNAALLSAIQSAKDYAESLITNQVSGFLIYKYEVDTFNDLPAGLTDENNGWLYHIKDTGAGYYWFGGEWNQLDASVDLSGYATEDYVNTAISNIPEYVLPQATDTVLGGVKSSSISGKGYIEGTGVISINGWDALNAAVSNLSNNKQNLLSTGQLNAANSGITNTKVSDYDTHISDAVKHITSAERTAWNGKQNALNSNQMNAVNSGTTTALVNLIPCINALWLLLAPTCTPVNTNGTITITWTKVPGAYFYRIWRINSSNTWTSITQGIQGNDTSFIDTPPSSGTYRYAFYAINFDNVYSNFVESAAVIV